jgi:hypothetical protein
MLLEDFPLEIKVMIMSCAPDTETLRNITRASPEFYSAYRGARKEIFHKITLTTLGKASLGILDPWSATHVPHLNIDSPDRERIVLEVLGRYRLRLPRDLDDVRLELDESLAILSLHRKLTDIVEGYCKQKLSHSPLPGEEPQEPLPPSKAELHRLYRALYRYEFYSKLFGAGPGGVNTSVYHLDNAFNETKIVDLFLDLFPIHEVEEIACMHKFASDHYDEKNVPWDLASLGPSYLSRMMKATTRPKWLHLLSESPSINVTTMRRVLDAYERVVDFGEWDWAGVNDTASKEHEPTTGWLWASKRGIQNADFKLRRWGYVFWDEERLKNWKIDEGTMNCFPWKIRE